MNAVAVMGMGLGAFMMWEAWKGTLDPLTTLKTLLTSSQGLGTTQGGATAASTPGSVQNLQSQGVAPTTILHAGTGVTA